MNTDVQEAAESQPISKEQERQPREEKRYPCLGCWRDVKKENTYCYWCTWE